MVVVVVFMLSITTVVYLCDCRYRRIRCGVSHPSHLGWRSWSYYGIGQLDSTDSVQTLNRFAVMTRLRPYSSVVQLHTV